MIEKLARQIIARGTKLQLMVATAESCTGGLIAGALTEVAGSSAVFERGFVTYSNKAKTQMLGVPMGLIESEGAVSQSVVSAMVSGALENSRANIAVAVTGIAGPGGGSAEKPVGLVFLAAQRREEKAKVSELLLGDIGRKEIRSQTVEKALEMVLELKAASLLP